MRFMPFFCTAALLINAPALAIEPRTIGSAKQVKREQGAVRISIQSQTQQMGTLHLWFVREGGDPSRSADVLKFERKSGVPLLGTNMVDSRPLVYSVPPGRYRLVAHGVGCPAMPPPGTYACQQRMNNVAIGTMPAGHYAGDVPSFEVLPGKLTEAGEFILEARPGSPVHEGEAIDFAFRDHAAFQVRVRAAAGAPPAGFAGLGAGPQPYVPAGFVSQISCRQRPKGAMMYLPFSC